MCDSAEKLEVLSFRCSEIQIDSDDLKDRIVWDHIRPPENVPPKPSKDDNSDVDVDAVGVVSARSRYKRECESAMLPGTPITVFEAAKLSCSWKLDDHELTIVACWSKEMIPTPTRSFCPEYAALDYAEAFGMSHTIGSWMCFTPDVFSWINDRRSILPVAPPEDPCDTAGPGPHVSEVAFVSALWCGARRTHTPERYKWWARYSAAERWFRESTRANDLNQEVQNAA